MVFSSTEKEREMLLKRKQSTNQTQIAKIGMIVFRDREADNRQKGFFQRKL